MTREDEKRERKWRKRARANVRELESPHIDVNVGRHDCTLQLWEDGVPGLPFWRVHVCDSPVWLPVELHEYATAEVALAALRDFAGV